MSRLGLFFTICVGGCVAFACSNAPSGGIAADPMDGGKDGNPLATGEGGIKDAAPPPADYRDPRAADGACNPPNLQCGDPDAGDTGPGYGGCAAVTVDHNNCGACGKACIGVDSVCVASRCDCNAVGFDYCAGSGCMDVTADINNCGRCGIVCDQARFNACANSICTNQ